MRWWKFLILFAVYMFYILVMGGLVFQSLEQGKECAQPTNDPKIQDSCASWNWYNSSFVSFTAITTIGYGNMAPTTQGGRGWCVIYSLFGVPLNAVVILTIAGYLTRLVYWIMDLVPHHCGLDDMRAKVGQVCLGLSLALIFLFIFIIIPSLAFWADEEGQWTFLDAFYFSFITLSTIGFGDIVAGKGAENARRHTEGLRFLAELLMMMWIVLGLSFMIMVFNIITESATTSVKKLTKKQKKKVEETIEEMLVELEKNPSVSIEGEEDKQEFAHTLAQKIAQDLAEQPKEDDHKGRNSNPAKGVTYV